MEKDIGNYIVFSDGRVYSKRFNKNMSAHKCGKAGNDYYRLRIDRKMKYVHRLVAETFIDNPENKKEVNHKDGDRFNNNVENLEWCSRSENQKHAFDTGLQSVKKGSLAPRAVLSQNQADEMRRLYKDRKGSTIRGLGREFGVSQRTAQRVLRNQGYLKDSVNQDNNKEDT